MQQQIKDVVRLLNDKVDSSLFSPFHHKLSNLDGLHAKVELLVHNMHSFLQKEHFEEFVNDQACINESLCTENILARFTWKSGLINNNLNLVPWEV